MGNRPPDARSFHHSNGGGGSEYEQQLPHTMGALSAQEVARNATWGYLLKVLSRASSDRDTALSPAVARRFARPSLAACWSRPGLYATSTTASARR